MEKFILRGEHAETRKKFLLNLPVSKRFKHVAIKSSETRIFPELLISMAVKRMKFENCHTFPSATIGGEYQDYSKTLQHLLQRHPFPLSQGPVNLALDTNTEARKSVGQVVREKTVFSHNETQVCAKYSPSAKVTTAWNVRDDHETVVDYKVTELDVKVEGVASTSNMNLVYTCQLQSCCIECPCRLCTAQDDCCKLRHRSLLCNKCNPQCNLHSIKVPHLYDPTTDLYTIVTEHFGKFRFCYGYAGIPSSCVHCSQDVLFHQVYHLVEHTLCRFCKFETRALEFMKKSVSLSDYEKAEKTLAWRDRKTCEVCLKECKDKNAKHKHIVAVHSHEDQKYLCSFCPKSYSSKSSLSYHLEKHTNQDSKHPCDLCGKQLASEASLTRHKLNIHKTEREILSCDLCGTEFNLASNLRRHQREQHIGPKFNIDFHEGFDPPRRFKCDKCDLKFMRNTDLGRHIKSVHAEKIHTCLECDMTFARKDTLNRHVMAKHPKEDILKS